MNKKKTNDMKNINLFDEWKLLEDKNDPYGEENRSEDYRVPENLIGALGSFISHAHIAKENERIVSNYYERILPASIDFLSSENVYVDKIPIAEMRDEFSFVEFSPSFRGESLVIMTLHYYIAISESGSELEIKFDQNRWNRFLNFLANYRK
jgi:hypothetical protein